MSKVIEKRADIVALGIVALIDVITVSGNGRGPVSTLAISTASFLGRIRLIGDQSKIMS